MFRGVSGFLCVVFALVTLVAVFHGPGFTLASQLNFIFTVGFGLVLTWVFSIPVFGWGWWKGGSSSSKKKKKGY